MALGLTLNKFYSIILEFEPSICFVSSLQRLVVSLTLSLCYFFLRFLFIVVINLKLLCINFFNAYT